MKLFSSFVSLLSLSILSASISLAHPEVGSSADQGLGLIRDTYESGLEQLGQRSHERKARHAQLNENSKRDKPFLSKWGRVTYYAGNQLEAPACGGPTPTDDDPICAVGKDTGTGSCGQTIHLHWKGKMAPCKIVDVCEDCSFGQIDVSKSVFQKLDSLEQGVLEGDGLHFRLLD